MAHYFCVTDVHVGYILAQMLWQRILHFVEHYVLEADARKCEFDRPRILLQDDNTSLWQERPPLKHLPPGMR